MGTQAYGRRTSIFRHGRDTRRTYIQHRHEIERKDNLTWIVRSQLKVSIRCVDPPTNTKFVGYHRNISQKHRNPKSERRCQTPVDPSRRSFVQPFHTTQPSIERPLRPPLHELVNQQSQIRQHEPTHIKREELRRVPYAELQSDVRLRRMPQPWILDLARDLICRNKIRSVHMHIVHAVGTSKRRAKASETSKRMSQKGKCGWSKQACVQPTSDVWW